MKTDQEITSAYVPLFDRFANMTRLTNDPPLLAHYTSIPVMESILRDETVWFSNPLFMNDVEEMRFGIFEGSRLFSEPERLQSAADSSERAIKLESMFQHFRTKFENEDAFDTYIFCVAEHDRKNFDGLLSMWRGYGVHGNGAALVLDPSRVTLVPGSPFILATVSYAPTEQRLQELQELLDQWGKLTKSLELPDDKLYIASYMAFQIIKTYALTTKHSGFSEEQEWRVVYQRDRDQDGLLRTTLDIILVRAVLSQN
jgi:hypothetical protein